MSLDRSLKTKPSGLNQHRNVLTRAERIAQLSKEGNFDEDADSPLNLPKVAHRLVVTAKKKKTAEEGEEGADGTAEAAGGDDSSAATENS